ncbi:hypothetical protein BRADI_1g54770v3 [Brachypodium distachyon]|uniref:F-box domain-containing protein n=1 Tax=Brachypodium distachyon TaxID=15368 RepID=A0A0Q3NSM7_BRADI|nr:hypothetical protein BRADI_1g54770v3 [Brachypodium distachyon]
MASPTARIRTEEDLSAASSVSPPLPSDALFEILLRLPAKELCRLRAVRSSWRSLTRDASFIKDHTARHKGPYLATTLFDQEGESCGVSIIDLSSCDVIKRIYTVERGFRLQRTDLDLVCLVGGRDPLAVTVLNPATGATLCPSLDFAKEYEYLLERRSVSVDLCALGKVPSTGDYKVLRVLRVRSPLGWHQLCEIMTLDSSNHTHWRAKRPGPLSTVHSHNKKQSVVIHGVVYFLLDYPKPHLTHLNKAFKPGSIASFNLETEEWMPTINGPDLRSFYEGEDLTGIYDDPDIMVNLSITNLNGSLVMVHILCGISVSIWFLTDLENALWVKRYGISSRHGNCCAYPLALLDDDQRIILLSQANDAVQSYDPKTDTYSDMLHLEDCSSTGIYTGSLLY